MGFLPLSEGGHSFQKIGFCVNKKLRTNVSCPKLPKIEGRSLEGKKKSPLWLFSQVKRARKKNFRDKVVGEGSLN